jgi:hypothetical protein
VSAALTTIASALPLLATIVIFFQRFAVFMLLLAISSSLFAFFCFTALSCIVGPKEKQDHFRMLFHWIRGKCCRR